VDPVLDAGLLAVVVAVKLQDRRSFESELVVESDCDADSELDPNAEDVRVRVLLCRTFSDELVAVCVGVGLGLVLGLAEWLRLGLIEGLILGLTVCEPVGVIVVLVGAGSCDDVPEDSADCEDDDVTEGSVDCEDDDVTEGSVDCEDDDVHDSDQECELDPKSDDVRDCVLVFRTLNDELVAVCVGVGLGL
jgi:F0F1-type ATP synthase assembly protein I